MERLDSVRLEGSDTWECLDRPDASECLDRPDASERLDRPDAADFALLLALSGAPMPSLRSDGRIVGIAGSDCVPVCFILAVRVRTSGAVLWKVGLVYKGSVFTSKRLQPPL